MSLSQPVSLGDVHSELSCLLHAATEEFKDLGGFCEITYNDNTYLNLEVEVWNDKAAQAVVARLNHGILWGGNDYRFRLVGRPLGIDDGTRRKVTAIVDLSNSRRQPDTWRWDHPRSAA